MCMLRRATRGSGTILKLYLVLFIEKHKHILFCPYTFALDSMPYAPIINIRDDKSQNIHLQIRNHLSAFGCQKADKCQSWSPKFFGFVFLGCFGLGRENRLLGDGICQTQNQVSFIS